jgi:hypothetical protein
MTDEPINNLRRELFEQGPMPRVYIEALQLCTEGATARVGMRKSDTERVAYWLHGDAVGELVCHGVNDEDARIEGSLTRLAELRSVKIAIAVAYDDFSNTSRFGRVLTIESPSSGELVFDASPRSATDARLKVMENFIGAVLDAYAGQTS